MDWIPPRERQYNKLLKDNIGEYTDLSVGEDISNRTHEGLKRKRVINFDYIKMKNFASPEDTIKRVKR